MLLSARRLCDVHCIYAESKRARYRANSRLIAIANKNARTRFRMIDILYLAVWTAKYDYGIYPKRKLPYGMRSIRFVCARHI